MSESSTKKENIKLVNFINELYKDWASYRKENKEQAWEDNLDAFLAQNSKAWKKKDAERKDSKENWRSNVVVRILKRKVITAWVFITDILFQGGEIPFMLKPTKGTFDETNKEAIEEKASKMEDVIRGQLTECQAERQLMRGILQMALYCGTFIKAPVLKDKIERKWVQSYPEGFTPDTIAATGNDPAQFAQFDRQVQEKKIPAIEYKSVWNMFVDPEVDDIKNARGIIERVMVSPFELVQLKGKPGYDGEAIDEVIARNRGVSSQETGTLPPNLRNITSRNKSIIYKEYWGRVPRAYIMDEADKYGQLEGSPAQRFDLVQDVEHAGDDVEVMAGIADDILIRLHINEGGERPYYYCPWEITIDEFYGTSCADNLQDVQTMVTGGVRNFVDNKALSGNVITGTVGGSMRPGQTRELFPGKNFEFDEGTDINKVFKAINIPDVGDSLLTLISLFERVGDQDSNLPTIMQGDLRPKQKPDTATEMNILMQNSGKYIGQVIRNIDEGLIENIIMGFYNYNMMRDDLDPQAMGDYECHALGFSSFYNKSVLLAALLRFLEITRQDPNAQSMVKFKAIYEKIGKALDLDPDELVFSDEEMQQAQQAQMEMQRLAQEEQLKAEESAAIRQAETEDQMKDNELEREMVREDVKQQHAMNLKRREAIDNAATQRADQQHQNRLAMINAANKPQPANGR
jgi:hypothetical protein